jgi:hypothetical protein
MKKLSVALAVTSALGASVANAAIVTEYANGAVVPWVTFDAADETTAIGLISCAAGDVYWTFFDVDSNHIRDGVFPVTANDQVGLTWSDPEFSGIGGLQGVDGYMTFVLDTDGDSFVSTEDSTCLAANAFWVDVPANDVSYIPVFPINMVWGDFLDANADGIGDDQLGLYTSASIAGLWAGAQAGDVLHMRYLVDFAPGGLDSEIFIWSAPNVANNYTVFQYDDDQNRNSIQMFLDNRELNILDLESFDDFAGQSNFQDGFIEWNVQHDGVVSFTIVNDPAFQATQTLINPMLRPYNAVTGPYGVLERYNPTGYIAPPVMVP